MDIDHNLFGLLLTGGQSKRMQQDKSLIRYHRQTQLAYGFDLLSRWTKNVFVSVNHDQKGEAPFAQYPVIEDRYQQVGPIGGILSAMIDNPKISWLILACDLPFITDASLKYLAENRERSFDATCYQSIPDGLPEPMCAIYEAKIYPKLMNKFNQSICCPRKILLCSEFKVKMLRQFEPNMLYNINSPLERDKAQQHFDN